jgi:hypothetical protein
LRKGKNTYVRTINCSKTNKGQSAWFQTRSGLRKGSVLSLILFNIIMKVVCNKIKEKVEVSDVKAFIYDIMTWCDNMKELEIRLARGDRESKNYGFQVNLEKTVISRLSKRKKIHNNENK